MSRKRRRSKGIEDETSELVRQCFFWELLTGIGVG
jgi:hypothetical protein